MEKQEFLNQLRSFLKAASASRLSDTRILPTNAGVGDAAIEVDFWAQERSFSSADFPEPTPVGTHVFIRLGAAFRLIDDAPMQVKQDSRFSGYYCFISDCVDVTTAKGILLGELDDTNSGFSEKMSELVDDYNKLVSIDK